VGHFPSGAHLDISAILGFFGLVALVSLSGVMMPGPVTAGTIAKAYTDKYAGMQIAIGHGFVEFPLVAVIGLGLGSMFKIKEVMIVIGLVGGLFLLYIGYNMIKMRKELDKTEKYFPYHPVIVGVLTTASNPYFFFWWATIGLLLISEAIGFGLIVFAVFAVLHWLCDFVWDHFVSYTVFSSKKFWTERVHHVVFGVFGGLMIFFGFYFIISPWLS
jgi:threonine/homoserine/homoserine lactone efflux protein